MKDTFSFFQLNCPGLSANWELFRVLICNLHGDSFSFDLIRISEIYKCSHDSRLSLTSYHNLILRCREDGPRGIYFIKETLNYVIDLREDISVFIPYIFEPVFNEIVNKTERNVIAEVIYRLNTEPHVNIDIFSSNVLYHYDHRSE